MPSKHRWVDFSQICRYVPGGSDPALRGRWDGSGDAGGVDRLMAIMHFEHARAAGRESLAGPSIFAGPAFRRQTLSLFLPCRPAQELPWNCHGHLPSTWGTPVRLTQP